MRLFLLMTLLFSFQLNAKTIKTYSHTADSTSQINSNPPISGHSYYFGNDDIVFKVPSCQRDNAQEFIRDLFGTDLSYYSYGYGCGFDDEDGPGELWFSRLLFEPTTQEEIQVIEKGIAKAKENGIWGHKIEFKKLFTVIPKVEVKFHRTMDSFENSYKEDLVESFSLNLHAVKSFRAFTNLMREQVWPLFDSYGETNRIKHFLNGWERLHGDREEVRWIEESLLPDTMVISAPMLNTLVFNDGTFSGEGEAYLEQVISCSHLPGGKCR